MSRNIKLLFFAVLFANFQIFKFSNCHAQVPQKFNYQGIARDAKGNPLSQQRMTLKLTVLPTSDATEGEYEEIQTVTTNEFGLYTLQIGIGASTSLSTFKDIKWETGNKYIKVAIDPKGGSDFVDAGTNQLLSVPYAIYADKAGVAKNSGSTSRATNNFIEKTDGSGNVNATSQIFDNGTNIGIGTTSPIARVHVNANSASVQEHIRMQNLSSTGAGRFTMYNNNTGAYATFTKYGTNYAGGYAGISSLYPYANLLAFGNNDTNNAGNGNFLISSEGNTGISIAKGGTSLLKFHVQYTTERVGIGGNALPSAKIHFNTSTANDTIKFTNSTTGHLVGDGTEIRTNGNTTRIINRENGFTILGTNNADRLAIDGAGNVGIGTITPSTSLDVNGQIRIQGGSPGLGKVLTSDANGLATWQAPSGGGGGGFFQVSPANSNHIIYTNSAHYGKNFIVNADSVNYDGSGLDAKMLFISSKFAFRAGLVNSTNWNLDSTGLYSIGLGANPRAKGDHAVALGTNTIASGTYSTAMGANTNASGTSSTAMGLNTTASGQKSTAMGYNTTASGETSTTMGVLTTASGYSSTAMGAGTISSGFYSTSMGTTTHATGDGSTAMGDGTTASGIASTAMGYHTTAYNSGSTAMGNFSYSSGSGSTAMGTNTSALGQSSTAIGEYATALGNASTAIGNSSMASGDASTSIGNFTKAKSFSEIAIGNNNDTLSVTNANTWQGDSNRVFTVGNGTTPTARSTAFVVQQNGNVGIGVKVPQTKLDVNGQIKISGGAPGLGKVLTSDANGLATWQAPSGGGSLPTGTTNQTLRHDGTTWVANSALTNNGTELGIGIAASNVAPLTFANAIGKKINFYPAQPDGYCMGVEASDLRFAGGASGADAITFRTQGYNGTERLRIAGDGNVGIGTTSPTAKLSVNGTADKPGGGSWTVFSDRRLKNNIVPYQDGLNTLLKINPVKFHYNEKAGCDTKPEYVGVIAQELNEIAPYMVGHFQKDQTDYLNVDNSAMTYMLINAVKELSSKLESQQELNKAQQELIEKLSKKMDELSTR